MLKWRLVIETQKGVKRYVLRRGNERMSVTDPDFAKYRDNRAELDAYVVRLNKPIEDAEKSKKRLEVEHAYINDALLAEFEKWRIKRTGGSERIPTETHYLREYVIKFFVGRQGLPNPRDWRTEEQQDAWWAFLTPLAPATRQDVVGTANRFISWLRELRGTAEVPEFKLSPISGRVFKRELANWKVANEEQARTAIPWDHWRTIEQASRATDIRPHLMLAYCFGLRRSEILGVKPGDAGDGALTISRVLTSLKPLTFEAPKSAETRRIPYWFAKQTATLKWIEAVAAKRMDPDTLTSRWTKLIQGLVASRKLPRAYSIHDLRHTFITRAANQYSLLKVKSAAGHEDIRTTMKYVHDMDEAA